MSFRNVPRAAALEGHARDLACRLQRIEQNISRCHVTLEKLADGAAVGATYVVDIELTVPGAQIRADSLRADGTAHASLDHALAGAYENAGRQLRDLRQSRSNITLGRRRLT